MTRPKTKCIFWAATAAIAFTIMLILARGAMAQPPASDDIVWWLCRESDALTARLVILRDEVGDLRESLIVAREEVAGLKGWIAAAAGVPIASGGGLMAWRKRKNGRKA